MPYTELCTVRETTVDGVSNWLWPVEDTGAWDGPVSDWEISHKEKFFKYLKGTQVVFTAGGNCGLYTRLYAKVFDAVYSFEPDPFNFHCLVNNNQLDNVIKIQGALGAENKMITMDRHTMTNVGMHTINEDPNVAFIPMFRIDDFHPRCIDLIQLDVEGYEIHALTGGLRNINEFRPVISVERSNDEIKELLRPFGYKAVDVSVMDTIFVSG